MENSRIIGGRLALVFIVAAGAAGCASDKVKQEGPKAGAPRTHVDSRDPWEEWNRGVQSFNDGLDDYFMKPVAKGYQWATPKFVDKGVTNFFSNVDDVSVIANDLLQFKLLQTGQDLGRFLVNSTIGMAGFIDVADKLDLPKHYEDFDQTLATWGVPSGPYLVLPVIGPGSPRGVVGFAGDTAANPINYITPASIPWGAGAGRFVDVRADMLSATKIADEASVDRYEFIRNAYFQQRNYLIHDGNPPLGEDFGGGEGVEMEFELQGIEDRANEAIEKEKAKPVSP
ncbi:MULTISPECIES: MlaA family lipoprotein [Methylococcus]|jgi:phospholipid-binding lipoprotein MlaA|uniref:MlaA family lipoprotein n=1 Tax=Methylococcus TaxID=413 RepID=UPI001C52D700|nr:VacJ family lipoprotein [Methylococcus capsulatus]QXP87307.1 VacJ family lipoprotein [Methylococcus capsulatus]QXP92952.1 VacJ family lipoprotein [Methylococcus capsulatus]UQN12306.1 VacJ family lipoprotein [Methylococcus capsulatus]